MTSATDELRRLLDERGVEWTYECGTVSYASDGHWCHAWAYNDDAMCVSMGYFTPEQAVAATLGRGTCHETIINHYWRGCGSCGYIWEFMYGIGKCERPHYCPACGKQVVE